MKRLGTFKTTDFKDFGINYLHGVLHTFGSLNQPDSTLAYDYDIVEVNRSNSDLVITLKEQIPLFSTEQIVLDSTTDEEFKISLTNWLFEIKLVSDYRMEREIDFVFKLIKEITEFTSIYSLSGLDTSEFSYNFGVGYEHFVLEADRKLYLIYFCYTD
jgi:hypothetical protein